jgi:hypothetical protein
MSAMFLRALASMTTIVLSSAPRVLGAQAAAVQHLPSGDSIAITASGPATVPNQPTGLLVRFYPYSTLGDTNHLRDLAVQLWRSLRPRLDSLAIPWLVLQATDQTPEPHVGFWHVENYGFVVERRSDGRWYFLHQTDPLK